MRKCLQGEKPWPLFLYGGVGGGKTCAVLVLCDAVARSRYWTAPELHNALVAAQRGELEAGNFRVGWKVQPGAIWKEWEDAPLAVLDELGTRQTVSDAMFETVKRAIDLREGSPAVFVSNIGLDEVARAYDDRIASRLGAGTVFSLEAVDRRLSEAGTQ